MLETPRLRLRRPEERDIKTIVAIAGDWEVARRLSRMPHPYDTSHASFFLDEVVTTELSWAITRPDTDAMIGVIGLHEDETGDLELGYYLAVSAWGRSFATEAGEAICSFARDGLGVAFLRSGYHADNPASGRVLIKLGFRETGRDTRFRIADDAAMESVKMLLDFAE